MTAQFFLGLSIAALFLPLGLTIGFNAGRSVDVKRLKRAILLRGVYE
jgi:hypothetical protein